MRVHQTTVGLLLAVILLLVGSTPLVQGQAAQRGGPIRLKAVTFDPSNGGKPDIPPGLAGQAPAFGQRGYYLVQFAGPVSDAAKTALNALGAEALDYIPDYAFKVRMEAQQAAKVRRLADVVYVDLFHPFYAVSPEIGGEPQLVSLRIERGGDAQAVQAAIARAGAELVGAQAGRLIVAADGAQIEAIAQARDVAWIEPYLLFEKHNEYGGGQVIGAGIANTSGYNGSSQIAAVADTGIGGGTAATAHRDIPAADVVAVQNFPGVTDSCFRTIQDDGAIDVDSGHGTHVAGSVLSRGAPDGMGKGVAPAAKLVFQATENYVVTSSLCKRYGLADGYYLTGLDDLYNLYQQAYNAGARIHANSWGSSVAGDYTANSASTDQFIWDNRDMTITFSAGNSGVDTNADGVVDNDSIGAPATAKNVITIGASENDRQGNYQCDTGLTYVSPDPYQNGLTCSGMNGQNLLGTPRQRWGFTANPIADDLSAGNANQMAAFSSRGPTDDGRIKPDVVAPGTWILSTYANQYRQGYDSSANPRTGAFQSDGWGMPVDAFYKYFGGTSMSNPIAAGAATVVRDFYQKAESHSASSALVKATLINSAIDLLDENNDGVNDNDFPIPNVHEGWGRVDLVAATDGSANWLDNTSGVGTGGSAVYTYDVSAGDTFKVTLVWSDFPSTEAAALNLVNNLNLTVTSPTGTVYRGNVFSGGWSQTGGNADSVNNVENVYIQSAAGGTWTVTVSGANVPQGPQPFALVARGGAGSEPPPPPPAPAAPSGLSASAVSSSQINLTWTDNSSDETGFVIERCSGAGCSNFATIATVGANTTSYSNSGLAGGTSYSYRVIASNSGGNSAPSNSASATTQANTSTPEAPSNLGGSIISANQINLFWTDNSSNESGFSLERCEGRNCTTFAVIATLGANVTTYNDSSLNARTYYRYRVRAFNSAGNSAYSNVVQGQTPR